MVCDRVVRPSADLQAWWGTMGVVAVCLLGGPVEAAEKPRPNIIFVLADDLGWSELGCYGNRFHETRHLDAMARRGMRFTQAYAAAPVCSPYRAALLTGQHPARVGIIDYLRPNSANALSTAHVTLPEMLARHGYRTGMIGKWHLTGYAHHGAEHEVKPASHGFAWDTAREVKGVGNGANFWPFVFRKQPIRWLDLSKNRLGEREYLVDRMNLEAVEFIARNKDRPFFLYLSHYATHSILNGKPKLVDKYRQKHKPGPSTRTRCYLCQDAGHEGDALHHWAADHNPHLAAMLESIDEGIGLIQSKLDELGLLDNTILVFTSDNGGETNVTSNAPLRGGKSQLYEGGVRVPMIVQWPGHTPASSQCDQPTVNLDFYPTLLEAAGIEPDKSHILDGVSTLASWHSPRTPIEREAIHWHYPLDRPHFLGGRSAGAIRRGPWKLIEFFDTGEVELYPVATDVSESRNMARARPELVAELRGALARWRESVGARRASPPMLVRPSRLVFADHFSDGQVSKRWFFNADWEAIEGRLQRADSGSRNTRIFARDLKYSDCLIRFDFQLQASNEIRLVTGGGGAYNAVVHITPEHFCIETGQDKRGPYFQHWHGECAYRFQPNRWYTMTVEFSGDRLAAHVDREHVAVAQHPILDRTRTYFAFQVDDQPAAIDNVQMFQASRVVESDEAWAHVADRSGRFPVTLPPKVRLLRARRTAHDRLYQTDATYRRLVLRVKELDKIRAKKYPRIYVTHKEIHQRYASRRKRLLAEDPRYKKLLFATYRAERAKDEFLVKRRPEVGRLPESRRKRALELLRQQFARDSGYKALVEAHQEAEVRLDQAYPDLFISDKQINADRDKRRRELKGDQAFREMEQTRAAAWNAREDYINKHDPSVKRLLQKS